MPRKRSSRKIAKRSRVNKKGYVNKYGTRIGPYHRTMNKYPNPYYTHRIINGKKRLVKITKKRGKVYIEVVEDRRKVQRIEQPRKVKQQYYQHGYYPGTMEKELPDNLAKGIKEIGKDEYEHSIAIDFEREIEQPQRMAIVEGGKTETLKIDDFEIFGHTHPGQTYPRPSTGDLRNMNYLEPEFIVAGKTGKIFLYNIEDPEKYASWKRLHESRKPTDYPITYGDFFLILEKKKYRSDTKAQQITPYNYEQSELGREIFFEATGVRIYPYRKKTIIEMKDDPHYEKKMPSVPYHYQQKYHKQRKAMEKRK